MGAILTHTEPYDDLRRLRTDPDIKCLLDIDPEQFQVVENRPYSGVMQCSDAKHFDDFFDFVGPAIPGFKPHPMISHGGCFPLAPDERVRNLELADFRLFTNQEVATAIYVKKAEIARILCASHWPCGLAVALGLNAVDVIDLTLKSVTAIEATYEAFWRQMALQDPEGHAAREYDWAMATQVVPLLHVGYEDKQNTYFIAEEPFVRALTAEAVSITSEPLVNLQLLHAILDCSAIAEELAVQRIEEKRRRLTATSPLPC